MDGQANFVWVNSLALGALLAVIPLTGGCSHKPLPARTFGASDPLPSWNDGPAKKAIVTFITATTDKNGPNFVPPGDRIAAFDQDGTTWVEQPIYTQVAFALDRLAAIAPQHPEWARKQPFKAVISSGKEAIGSLSVKDIEAIVLATQTGMTTEAFEPIARDWVTTAKNSRYQRPYSEMVYEPMLEVMHYLRNNGYKVYIVTGGEQDFVRSYSPQVYGIPAERIIGSALKTQYEYGDAGQAMLVREPKLLLNNDYAGKPEDIYLFLGHHPKAAFGNSNGDRQMLEYTQAGGGASLEMLVLHDDDVREYAYGPAQGLPDSKVGTFSQALFDEAKNRGWTVISMKRDWKRIFPWAQSSSL
jgi:haloacid dehalogenase-like hydrolase